MTLPFDGPPLDAQRGLVEELADWDTPTSGRRRSTAPTPSPRWCSPRHGRPSLRLGTAIVPAFTRGPATIAQSAASLAQAAPGRFVLGIGTSSNVIVEQWNGVPFDRPYQRTRDVVRFLGPRSRGEKVSEEYETFTVSGFTLGLRLEEPVPILVAALREGMLRLAGREADGAIVNWLSAEDVAPRGADRPPGGRRRPQGDRRPDLRGTGRRPRNGPGHRPPGDHQLPERARLRRLPRVAGPRRAAGGRCGTAGGRATEGRRWPPSPTTLSTSSWCGERRRPAVSTSSATGPTASTLRWWRCCPAPTRCRPCAISPHADPLHRDKGSNREHQPAADDGRRFGLPVRFRLQTRPKAQA